MSETSKENIFDNKTSEVANNHIKILDEMGEEKHDKWTANDNNPCWRLYLNSYGVRRQTRKDENIINKVVEKDKSSKLLLNLHSNEQIYPNYECFPLTTFNDVDSTRQYNKLRHDGIQRIWQIMEADVKNTNHGVFSEVKGIDSGTWTSSIWQNIEDRDNIGAIGKPVRMEKSVFEDLLPCQYNSVDELNMYRTRNNQLDWNYCDYKELGYAKIPAICMDKKRDKIGVDRASGDNTGLINGDYIVCEFNPGNDDSHVHTAVCLRGTRGMHLIELSRQREKTWKFCFYQALVALIVKTQLRYKYASSSNIDYIYDHAWMIFMHMGFMSIRKKFKLDDIIIYNCKYNVEVILMHELNGQNQIKLSGYKDLIKMRKLRRPELLKVIEEIGWEKINQPSDSKTFINDENIKNIEKWFNQLPSNCHSCIARTRQFALAFWKDGNFWYLYNPYRTDTYGLWDDMGYACIMKFCTKITLIRHLIVLLLLAYAREFEKFLLNKKNNGKIGILRQSDVDESGEDEKNSFSIQIFQVVYHCATIINLNNNLNLLLSGSNNTNKKLISNGIKTPNKFTNNKKVCNNDDDLMINNDDAYLTLSIEKSSWLRDLTISWSKRVQISKKPRWHQYHVEENGKLFSLWGDIHPSGELFTKENRGKQMYACYVVCAGMTQIISAEYWCSKILDAIVVYGDQYYTSSRLENQMYVSKNMSDDIHAWPSQYSARHFKIGNLLFQVDILPGIHGKLYTASSLWNTLKHMLPQYPFIILTCGHSRLGIFKYCTSYFMIDVNSFGPPIFNYSDGVVYLLKSIKFSIFIKTLILTIGTTETTPFTLNPVIIQKIIDTDT